MASIRDRIIEYLRQHPDGADDDELAAIFDLRYRQQANSRCRDLLHEGIVERRLVRGKLRNYYLGQAGTGPSNDGSSRMFAQAIWIPFAELSVSDLPHAGNVSGAYAFRNIADKQVQYVGGTNNLRRRLFGNYLGGIGGSTTQRIHDYLFNDGNIMLVEVGWWTSEEYTEKEAELKGGTLPPWNRR